MSHFKHPHVLAVNRIATRTSREKKNNSKAESLVYIFVDNRERARTRDTKQRRQISLEQQHENYIAAVRRWEMLATSEVKISGNGKKKSKKEHKKQNILWAHARLSLLKGVTQRKFHAVVVQNNGKEIEKTVLEVQSLLLFSLPSPFSITSSYFLLRYEWRCQGIIRRFRKPKHTYRKNTSRRTSLDILSKSCENAELKAKCKLWTFQCGEFSIDRMNMSKTQDCGRKLSPIIFLGNQMVYSWN